MQKALVDARAGNGEAVHQFRDQFGDRALPFFAAARFSQNIKERRAVLGITSDSYESLLFVLPLLSDPDPGVRRIAAMVVSSYERFPGQLLRVPEDKIGLPLVNVLEKEPELFRSNPELLLVLAQFKHVPAARTLLGKVLKAEGWNTFFLGEAPEVWELSGPQQRKAVAALLAQCEMGRFSVVQVQRLLAVNPKARGLVAGFANLLTNKALLRYTLSLIYDTSISSPSSGNDVRGMRVYVNALISLNSASKIFVDRIDTNKDPNATPVYDPVALARLYRFYGVSQK